MNIEQIREYCLSKKGVTESFPFDDTTLVFKVGEKMFVLTNIERETKITVKCNPETAIELREKYNYITGAFHMNKKHWNSIEIKFANNTFIKQQIDNSYNLVVNKMTKNQKIQLTEKN